MRNSPAGNPWPETRRAATWTAPHGHIRRRKPPAEGLRAAQAPSHAALLARQSADRNNGSVGILPRLAKIAALAGNRALPPQKDSRPWPDRWNLKRPAQDRKQLRHHGRC